MLDRFMMWLVTDGKILNVDTKWAIKVIAIKLKLYKPDKYELECIEHNKRARQKRRENRRK